MALADAVDLSSLALEDHNENGDTARRRQEEPREESPGHGEESSHEAQLRESLQLMRSYLRTADPPCQEHYLNHLGKMILIHVPVIFWAAWKVTSPFFDEFTKERMMFVEDKNLNSVLLEEIDEDQLPDIYGGKLPLEPV